MSDLNITVKEKGATLQTSCAGCVFAQYGKDAVQTDCKLGRIKKFAENGGVIETVENNFVIKNRVCNAKRDAVWEDKAGASPEIRVRAEIAIYGEIFFLINNKVDYNKIKASLGSLKDQSMGPNKIVFICNGKNNKITVPRLVGFMSDYAENVIPWVVRSIKSDVIAIDFAAEKCTSYYYTLFNVGASIPEDFFANIDEMVNDRMERFVFIKPDNSGNGMVVPVYVHKILCGNEAVYSDEFNRQEESPKMLHTLQEKIEYICHTNNKENLIKTWNQK